MVAAALTHAALLAHLQQQCGRMPPSLAVDKLLQTGQKRRVFAASKHTALLAGSETACLQQPQSCMATNRLTRMLKALHQAPDKALNLSYTNAWALLHSLQRAELSALEPRGPPQNVPLAEDTH